MYHQFPMRGRGKGPPNLGPPQIPGKGASRPPATGLPRGPPYSAPAYSASSRPLARGPPQGPPTSASASSRLPAPGSARGPPTSPYAPKPTPTPVPASPASVHRALASGKGLGAAASTLQGIKRSAAEILGATDVDGPSHKKQAVAAAPVAPSAHARGPPATPAAAGACSMCDNMVRALHGFHGLVNSESDFWLMFQPPPQVRNQDETMASLTHWSFHLMARLCHFAASPKLSYSVPGNTVQRSLLHEVAGWFGMSHESTGTGADRAVELRKSGRVVPRLSPMQLQGALQHALRNKSNLVSRGEEREKTVAHIERERQKARGELVPRPTEHKGTQSESSGLEGHPEGPVVEQLRRQLRAARGGALDIAALQRIEAAVAAHFRKETFGDLGLGSLLAVAARHADLCDAFNGRLCGRPPLPFAEFAEFAGQCQRAQDDAAKALTQAQVCAAAKAQFGSHCAVHGAAEPPRDTEVAPNVYYAAALTAEPGHEDGPEEAATGVFGDQDPDAGVRALRRCPFLADVAEHTQWALVFRPSLGPLRPFLRRHAARAGVHVVYVGDSGIRVDVQRAVTDAAFQTALQRLDAAEAVHYLLAAVAGSGGIQLAPLALVGNCVYSGLQAAPVARAVAFVLDCLALLPEPFRTSSLPDVTLLQPLSRAVPGAHALLLEACLPPLLPVLWAVGCRRGIPLWAERCKTDVVAGDATGPAATQPPALHALARQAEAAPAGGVSTAAVGGCRGRSEAPKAEGQVTAGLKLEPVKAEPAGDGGPRPDAPPSVAAAASGQASGGATSPGPLGSAKAVVEAIRRQEFGIGLEDLGPAGNAVLEQQHKRVGRALQRLAAELYTSDSHFVLELVQNADDNAYPADVAEPALQFVLRDDCLVVRNNECGFEERNVRAICDVGSSTKSRVQQGTGYIGQKGIGFKSVFRVTDTPQIHSNGYHIQFDCNSRPVRFIVPEWLDQWPPGLLDSEWATHIVLPFKPAAATATAATPAGEELGAQLQDLEPTLLLFLHRLRRITISHTGTGLHRDIKLSPHTDDPRMVTLRAGDAEQDWLQVRRRLQPPVPRDATNPNPGPTEITLAFPVHTSAGPLPPQSLFAFLPLRSYGLKFIVQADFVVPSNREDLDQSNVWNQWIRSELANSFVEAVEIFKDHPHFRCHFYDYIPLEGEVLSFLRPVATAIRARLQQLPCLLTAEGAWVPPSQALLDPHNVRALLPGPLLREALGLHYCHAGITAPLATLTRLGARSLTAEHLLDALHALSRAKRLPSLGLAWLADAYLCFARLLDSGAGADDAPALLRRWAALPTVPTCGGAYAAPAHRPVFREPAEGHADAAADVDRAVHAALGLEMLDPAFGTGLGAAEQGLVQGLLERVGVRPLTPLEVVDGHLVPWLIAHSPAADLPGAQNAGAIADQWEGAGHVVPDADAAVYEAFARYAQRHWPALRAHAAVVDALRQRLPIRTQNRGHVTAAAHVHFGAAYDSRAGDLLALLPQFPLPVLSDRYLTAAGPDAAADASTADPKPWRAFFEGLGVVDFLPLHHRTVAVPLQSDSPWASAHRWPSAEPPGYEVEDVACPPFAQLVRTLRTPANLRTLVRLVGAQWDHRLAAAARATTSFISAADSGRRRERVSCPSTFGLELQSLPWVPSQKGRVLAPRDLFYPDPEVRATFGDLVDYADEELSSFGDAFAAALHLHRAPTLDSVLACLESVAAAAAPPDLAALVPLYAYCATQLPGAAPRLRSAFAARPLILVPSDDGPARFRSVTETVWEDPAEAGVPEAYVPLAPHLPPALAPLFAAVGVLPAPDIRQYAACLAGVAERGGADARATAVRVFEQLSAAVGDGGDGAPGVAEVRELLRGRRVFPTEDGPWLPMDDPRLLCDDAPHLCAPFRGRGAAAILDLGTSVFSRVSAFVSALGLPVASRTITTTATASAVAPDPVTHALLADVLCYVQRYIYSRHAAAYKALVEAGTPEALATRFRAVRGANVRVTYALRGVAAPPQAAACALSGWDLYSATGLPTAQQLPKVCYEFTRLFLQGPPHAGLVNFLQLLALLPSDEREEYVRGAQGVGPLPATELVWELPAPPTAAATEDVPAGTAAAGLSEGTPNGSVEMEGLETGERTPGAPRVVEEKGPAGGQKEGAAPQTKKAQKTGKGASGDPECVDEDVGAVAAEEPAPEPSAPAPPASGEGSGGRRQEMRTEAAETIRQLLPEIGVQLGQTVGAVDVLDIQSLASAEGTLFVALARFELKDAAGQPAGLQGARLEAIKTTGGAAVLNKVQPLDDGELHRAYQATQEGKGRGKNAPGQATLKFTQRRGKPLVPKELRVTDNQLSEEARKGVGRWGEEVVYLHLCKEHAAGNVQWVNHPTESGKPYDITLEVDGETHFVEVKSSKTRDKTFFEVSHNEWLMAWREGMRYHIYRVYGTGAQDVSVVEVQDPWNAWQRGEISVCLVV